jgi:hypothetical protein
MKLFLILLLFGMQAYASNGVENATPAAIELHNNLITNLSDSEVKNQVNFLLSQGFEIYKKGEVIQISRDCSNSLICSFQFLVRTSFLNHKYNFQRQYIQTEITWSNKGIDYDSPDYGKAILKRVLPLDKLPSYKLISGTYEATGKFSIRNAYESFNIVSYNNEKVEPLIKQLISSGFKCDVINDCFRPLESSDPRLQLIAKKKAVTKLIADVPWASGVFEQSDGSTLHHMHYKSFEVFRGNEILIRKMDSPECEFNFIGTFQENKPTIMTFDGIRGGCYPHTTKDQRASISYVDESLLEYFIWGFEGLNNDVIIDNELIALGRVGFEVGAELKKIK